MKNNPIIENINCFIFSWENSIQLKLAKALYFCILPLLNVNTFAKGENLPKDPFKIENKRVIAPYRKSKRLLYIEKIIDDYYKEKWRDVFYKIHHPNKDIRKAYRKKYNSIPLNNDPRHEDNELLKFLKKLIQDIFGPFLCLIKRNPKIAALLGALISVSLLSYINREMLELKLKDLKKIIKHKFDNFKLFVKNYKQFKDHRSDF